MNLLFRFFEETMANFLRVSAEERIVLAYTLGVGISSAVRIASKEFGYLEMLELLLQPILHNYNLH